jgi:hypothetical protein
MGLLDDAIREHLDLKRRRGADPAEVEKAEREALGPVRRVAEGQEVPELAFEPTQSVAPQYDEPEYQYDESGLEYEDEVSEDIAPQGVYPEPPPIPAEPRSTEPSFEPFDEAAVDSDLEPPPEPPLESPGPAPAAAAAEPAPPAGEPGVSAAPHRAPEPEYKYTGEETVEYDVEEALETEQAEAGDDVLEETPEFLQDTPDHDRLWFEQKPPRDFDFDG